MAVDPEWLRRIQQQALAGAQQNPVANFNPEMLAANASMPNPNMGGGLGGLLRRGAIGFQNGLGRLQQGLFPIDSASAAGMSAEDIKNARNQAMLRMGLGMMSSANQGARGGEALAHGFGLAQGGMTDDLQRRMANERVARQEQRQTERDQIGDERYAEQFQYQQQQDRTRQEMERQAQEESRRRFEESLALDRRGLGLRERALDFDMNKPSSGLGKPPSGYRWKVSDSGEVELEAIPGGPATTLPAEVAGRKAFLDEAQKATQDVYDVLFSKNGGKTVLNRGAVMAGAIGSPGSEGRMARDRITVAVEAALRAATGAAAPDAEVERYTNLFTPSVLDSDEAALKKWQTLNAFVRNASANIEQGRTSGRGNQDAPLDIEALLDKYAPGGGGR